MSDSEEEFVPEDETEEGPVLVKKLRERLKKAVEEKQEYLEGWQRARADFANFKKEEALMHADKEARIKDGIGSYPDYNNYTWEELSNDEIIKKYVIE